MTALLHRHVGQTRDGLSSSSRASLGSVNSQATLRRGARTASRSLVIVDGSAGAITAIGAAADERRPHHST